MLCVFFSFWLKLDAARSLLRKGPRMSSARSMGKELWPIFCHFAAIGCSSLSASEWTKNELCAMPGERNVTTFCHFAAIGCSLVSSSERAKNQLRAEHGGINVTTFLSFCCHRMQLTSASKQAKNELCKTHREKSITAS